MWATFFDSSFTEKKLQNDPPEPKSNAAFTPNHNPVPTKKAQKCVFSVSFPKKCQCEYNNTINKQNKQI